MAGFMGGRRNLIVISVTGLALCLVATARADIPSQSAVADVDALFDEGKLLATGGVSSVEGSGGGGLSTWALITGYGTRDGIGIDAHATYIPLPDYRLTSWGGAIGVWDRFELSYARQNFDTGNIGERLGLGRGFTFNQDIYGAKIKLLGDAVYDQDSWLPQLAAGIQYKNNDRDGVIHAIGARSDSGADLYVAATKLFLAQSLLVDATLRETRANQFGLLGFGGNVNAGDTIQFEGSIVYLLSRQWAAGAEFRSKPDNLGIAHEDGAWDIFAAWFPTKNVSLTAGYVDLGNIVIANNQHGLYLSVQTGL
jgi:hypothetical protein